MPHNKPLSIDHKSINHTKTHSLIPSLSLSEIEQNYHLLKRILKNAHNYTRSNLSSKKLAHQQQLEIKSPFYDRTKCSNQRLCKCQYHRKQRFQIENKFTFIHKRTNFNKNQILSKLTKLETLGNQNNGLNHKNVHKKFNSLVSESNDSIHRDSLLKQIQNKYGQRYSIHQFYLEYLKKIKQQRGSGIDCYNMQFEQFLKNNQQWILRGMKNNKRNSRLNLNKDQHTLNQNTKSRSRTMPGENDIDENEDDDKDNRPDDKQMKMNFQELKKSARRKNKNHTVVSFPDKDGQNNNTKKSSLIAILQKLKPEQRHMLQDFMIKAYKDLGIDIDMSNKQNLTDLKIFSILCKNLLDSDLTIVSQAKNILRKISRLPIQLFQAILKQTKNEIKKGLEFNLDLKAQDMEKAVSLAFNTIQGEVEKLVKKKQESKGKQKLSIMGRLKGKYTGRGSLFFYKSLEDKNKLRFSGSQFLNGTQNIDSKRSRFANEKTFTVSSTDQVVDQIQLKSDQYESPSIQQLSQTATKINMTSTLNKQKTKQFKKGQNLSKKTKNENIIKKIDEEIQQSGRKLKINKMQSAKVQDEYLKERAESRKKLRDMQTRQHLQFLVKMRQKQLQRQSSTMSSCELKKNNLRSHYQRHKLFLKRMQGSLTQNKQLKEVVINYEDDLLTKKRKVRILKNMISEHAQKQSQFCRDIIQYIEIFEKNCNMIIGKSNWGKINNQKKYTKRLMGTEKNFDYEVDQQSKGTKIRGIEDLTELIKMDKELKFYTVSRIECEEEEDFTAMKLQQDIINYTSQLVKHTSRRKHIYLPNNDGKALFNLYDGSDNDLVQMGLEQKFQSNQLSVRTTDQQHLGTKQQNQWSQDQQNDEIRRMVARFNKNMTKYSKMLKGSRRYQQPSCNEVV